MNRCTALVNGLVLKRSGFFLDGCVEGIATKFTKKIINRSGAG